MVTPHATRRYVTFGNLLSMYLADAKMQQLQLAQKSGVPASIINKMVRGWSFGKSVKTISKYLQPVLSILIAEHVFTSLDQVKNFLEKSPLNNTPEGRTKISELLEIAEKAIEERKALDKPRYRTSHTEFIGREKDVNKIIDKLLHSHERIVTLVGVPGVGKTELAEQIIARDPIQRLFTTIPIFLGTVETSMTDVLKTKLDHITHTASGTKRILVVLHDCEVIEDTTSARAELIEFLKEQKQLTILATSRRAFRLGKNLEYKHSVTTLDVPSYQDVQTRSFADLQKYEAVELFWQAVKGDDEKFTLTEQNIETVIVICQAFNGLPLALLIAAALVTHETVERVYKWIEENGLLNRGYDRTDIDWHQSLYKLINRSYDLLEETEQKLFRRLAVFPGSCSIEAVAEICNLDNDIPTGTDKLSSHLTTLHNNSLITYTETKIKIAHNTILAFARSMLQGDQTECAKTINRFIDYCTELEAVYYGLGKDYDREIGNLIRSGLTKDVIGFDIDKDFYQKYSNVLDTLEKLYAVKLVRDGITEGELAIASTRLEQIQDLAPPGARFVDIREFQIEFDKVVKSSLLNEHERQDFLRKADRIAKIADAVRIWQFRESTKNRFILRDKKYGHPYALLDDYLQSLWEDWDVHMRVWHVIDNSPREYSFIDHHVPAETHACLVYRYENLKIYL